MKKKFLLTAVSIIIVIVLIAVLFLNKKETNPSDQKISYGDIPVSTISVKKMMLINTISLVGVVNASKDINVISEAQGLVVGVKVKVGDFVKEGTVLVQIDDVIMQSNLASAEINYLKAKRDFERSETLYQENLLNVSEKDAFQIKTDEQAEITTDVYPGVKFYGRVDNIASKADEAHTYQVEIRLSNDKKNPLKAGMFARVNFTIESNGESLVIPRESLVGSIKDARVFIVKDQRVKLKNVVAGRSSGNFLEILSGLVENEIVVTNGQNNLSDNSKVAIIK